MEEIKTVKTRKPRVKKVVEVAKPIEEVKVE